MPKERFSLTNFDYHLPKELIAQYPCAQREGSRLLVIERAKSRITHQRFTDIVDYLSAGDCLVLNDTKVVNARMKGKRAGSPVEGGYGGGKQEIFLLEDLSRNIYRVLAKPAKKVSLGTKIIFNNGQACCVVLADYGMQKIVKFSPQGNNGDFWQKLGQVPLPPYIKREPEDLDKQRYQTVYAQNEGATASATAGLHFTQELLERIRAQGINIVYLTLHINYGTFAPVRSGDIRGHKMHKEYFNLSSTAAKVINDTCARGKKVFAVGTTSVRVLETCAAATGEQNLPLPQGSSGWTDLFIYPPYRFKAVEGLLTNFHFPKSTLLMLVSAFAGKELLFRAYQEAIRRKYRFFSYGDATLII